MTRLAKNILVIGLVLALLAPCMAIAEDSAGGTLGVRDFLSPGAALPENFDSLVLSDFKGATAKLGDVTVTVRDAVTDGIGVYITMAYTANNPDDIVLIDFDYDMTNEPWKASQAVLDAQREEGKNRIVIGGTWPTLTEEVGTDEQPQSWQMYVGNDYMYEAPGTLVTNTILDLRRIEWTAASLPLTFAPFTLDTADPEEWQVIDTASVAVDIPLTQMPQVRLHAELPAGELHGAAITDAQLVLTPFASYLEVSGENPPYDGDLADDEVYTAHLNRMAGLWLVPLDAAGNPYTALAAPLRFDELAEDVEMPTTFTDRIIFSAVRGTPETLTLGVLSVDTGTLIDGETTTLTLTR